MSLDPPTYLASLQNNIRQRPIPWDGAVRAGTLTEDQLARIRAVDKVKKDARKQTVEQDIDAYRLLFIGEPGTQSVLESAAKRQDVVQYLLVLLSDLLNSTFGLLSTIDTGSALLTPTFASHQPSPNSPETSSPPPPIPIANSCLSSPNPRARTPPSPC